MKSTRRESKLPLRRWISIWILAHLQRIIISVNCVCVPFEKNGQFFNRFGFDNSTPQLIRNIRDSWNVFSWFQFRMAIEVARDESSFFVASFKNPRDYWWNQTAAKDEAKKMLSSFDHHCWLCSRYIESICWIHCKCKDFNWSFSTSEWMFHVRLLEKQMLQSITVHFHSSSRFDFKLFS